ncbi:Uncharacterised protein [Mycobacteroides abscessus]|nr:Uncharacterised protein [Mycobacteroides abscessus]
MSWSASNVTRRVTSPISSRWSTATSPALPASTNPATACSSTGPEPVSGGVGHRRATACSSSS